MLMEVQALCTRASQVGTDSRGEGEVAAWAHGLERVRLGSLSCRAQSRHTIHHPVIPPPTTPTAPQGPGLPPTRVPSGVKRERMQLILAVLSKHTDMKPFMHDIHLNVTGGVGAELFEMQRGGAWIL